jgi:Cu2+-exporting ATPase
MLVYVLTLSSAIALGSNILGRKTRSLRRKKHSRNRPQADSQDSSRVDSNQTQGQTHPNLGGGSSAPPSAGFYLGTKQKAQAIRKAIAISMGGAQQRDAQLQRLSTNQGRHGNIDPDDPNLDRRIKVAVGLMGLAAVGSFFYAPLLRIAGFATLINNVPVFKELSKNLKKGRITTELLEIVSQISFLVTGYFFLATFVCFVALLDIKLLRRTEQHSQQQLIDQFSQKRRSIWIFVDGAEVEIPLEAVRKNDFVIVNAGEAIPADGIVVEGIATIDQHSLTGESQPVERENGARVYATTVVLSGRILIQAEETGANTNAAKIGQILEQTQDFKESLRLRGKKIADGFIAPTLFVSSLTLPILGPSSALAVLWSGFGYDMKLYGPISVLNFLHLMAKNGILIKDGRSLETLRQLDTVVFDKTGTLTVEQPSLGRIYPVGRHQEETLLAYAAAAEHRQTHPVARAILEAAEQRGISVPTAKDASYQVGYGIQVTLKSKLIQVGSQRFMEQQGIVLPSELGLVQDEAHAMGSSLVYIAVDDKLAGILRLDPSIRPEAKRIIRYLKAQGIEVSIISGDHREPTRRLARELGVESFFADTLPAQKAELITQLRADGKSVGFVGDGINDAIALKAANVSISLSGASTVAMDTAQVILMDGDLEKIETLFEISRAFEKNMQTNFMLSMIPGTLILSGVFVLHMGVVSALAIYFASEMVALTNCMLPLIKDEMADKAKRKAGDKSAKVTTAMVDKPTKKPEFESVPDRS